MLQMLPEKRNLYAWGLLAAVGAVGVWTLLFATRPGIGLYSDSTYYLTLARRALSGNGYTLIGADGQVDPVAKYPFVYPSILAIPGLFQLDLLAGARWIGAIVFFANILIMGRILYRRSSGSTGAAVICALLTWTSYDILSYHSIALSDAPFLLCVLMGFSFMERYLDKPSWLLFSCTTLATGLAFATRYAGAAFVIAGCLAIMLWERKSRIRRICDAVLFGCSSSLLMVLWILRNMHYSKGATGRYFVFHPVLNIAQVKNLTLAFAAWGSDGASTAMDVYVRGPIIAALIFVLIVVAARFSIKSSNDKVQPALPLLYFLSYAAVLLLTSTFLQADLFLDSMRLIIPLHAFAIILALTMGNAFYRKLKSFLQQVTAVAVCIGMSLCFVVWTVRWAKDTSDDGQGYASSTFRDSEMLQSIKALRPDSSFYSNLPWPIGIYTDRVWSRLPIKIDISTFGEDREYPGQIRQLADTMRKPGVFLAMFKQGDDWFSFPTLEEIKALVPLRVVAQTEDGVLYESEGLQDSPGPE